MDLRTKVNNRYSTESSESITEEQMNNSTVDDRGVKSAGAE